MSNAQQQLEGFFDKYTPEIAAKALWILKKLRKRYPTATVWVYDNYNALAVGFLPNDRPSDAIVSIGSPASVDSNGLMAGSCSSGKHVRGVRSSVSSPLAPLVGVGAHAGALQSETETTDPAE